MPAQSPTLSPTLSAITAGFRGSSSGMPASIFPTRSAPTSAAFVKMPPPSRAKTEMSEPPNASPIRSSTAESGVLLEPAGEDPVVAGDPEQAEADDEQAGHRAGAERDAERRGDTLAGRLRGADVRAHGDVHADEAGRGRENRPDQEADRGAPAELVVEADREERHDGHERDRSCTACGGTRRRPPGRRGRSPASARSRPAASSATRSGTGRTGSRRPNRRARTARHGQRRSPSILRVSAQRSAGSASARGIMQHKPGRRRGYGHRETGAIQPRATAVAPTCSA